MRVRTAVPIIVVGLLLMLLGIGQRTVWAPDETVTASLARDVDAAPVTVIGPAARGGTQGSVEVTVEAEQPFVLAVGRTSDVEAWVGDAPHLDVAGVTEESLTSEYTDGGDVLPDPRGSDLWTDEESGDGTLTYRWTEPVEGDWSILLATDGEAPAPTDISVTRPNHRTTPFALPLIIGGAVVVPLGVALLLRAPRGRGDHRGRRDAPEGTRAHARQQVRSGVRTTSMTSARSAAVLVGLVGAGALLGGTPGMATNDPAPTPSSSAAPASSAPAPSTTGASAPPTAVATGAPSAGSEASGPPVVLDGQLERILGSVASAVSRADTASDTAVLAPRVEGAALDLRAGAYAVRAEDDEALTPAPVAAGPILLKMVPTDPAWPRSIVALTQGEDHPVPQALVLVQQSPRENYRLTSAVPMLPAGTFPSPPAPGASGPIALDEPGALAMAPQAAVAAIADYLTTPDGGHAETFEANSFADTVTEFQRGVVADPGNSAANITFTHTARPERTDALLTGDGGAMVFGYLTHGYSSIPRAEGDTIDLGGTVYESLTGEGTTGRGIDVTYGEAVMMYVPPAGSDDRIRVVGAAQQLLSATLR